MGPVGSLADRLPRSSAFNMEGLVGSCLLTFGVSRASLLSHTPSLASDFDFVPTFLTYQIEGATLKEDMVSQPWGHFRGQNRSLENDPRAQHEAPDHRGAEGDAQDGQNVTTRVVRSSKMQDDDAIASAVAPTSAATQSDPLTPSTTSATTAQSLTGPVPQAAGCHPLLSPRVPSRAREKHVFQGFRRPDAERGDSCTCLLRRRRPGYGFRGQLFCI